MDNKKFAMAAAVVVACAGFGLVGCHRKQSAGDQIKQGAQQMGQGIKQAGENAGQAAKDTGITAAVKTNLAAKQGLSSFSIHVETDNGIVTLTGTVDTESQRELAGNVAGGTSGVKGVNNEITVKQGG